MHYLSELKLAGNESRSVLVSFTCVQPMSRFGYFSFKCVTSTVLTELKCGQLIELLAERNYSGTLINGNLIVKQCY